MQSLSPSTGLTITNPLVLYRALLATKSIDPDPAQHRLALNLQKLYNRLKDYESEVDFSHRLDQINRTFKQSWPKSTLSKDHGKSSEKGRPQGIFSTFRAQKEKADAMALTRKLTSHESAIHLQSPQGLLLYGEVGTGKSMLVDLLADCLPNRKKRRWHFNTFMLETFARLEQLRRSRLTTPLQASGEGEQDEHSLVWLARDMISTSPILFLDEFQLPDRAASKILTNLFTSFFHLGGVLIATSNRMPEELANASGIEFAAPPASRLGFFGNRWGIMGSGGGGGRSENMVAGKGDFAAFLDVLRARCEIWDMEGEKDWRRREAEEEEGRVGSESDLSGIAQQSEKGFEGLEPMASGNWGLGYEQSLHAKARDETPSKDTEKAKLLVPKHFFIAPSLLTEQSAIEKSDQAWHKALLSAVSSVQDTPSLSAGQIDWEHTSLRVYGRNLIIPRHRSGVTYWAFVELCTTNLGPADYITLASTFHTLILTDVPILTLLHKNEARRLITLLDALYEARCKLLIRAEAGPDDLFFPEKQQSSSASQNAITTDGVYSETFSEIYQDQTSPFRPNISSYTSSASPPSYPSSPLPSFSPSQSPSPSSASSVQSPRSILADEDSDFGPVYGAGRSSSPNSNSRYRSPSDGAPGAGNEIGRQEGPDFARTGIFTGEDEKFAYKRARSRMWEMCGKRWWDRSEEGWWRPVGKAVRRWEDDVGAGINIGAGGAARVETAIDGEGEKNKEEGLFRHGASPFRTSTEAPPKIGWVHAWGMMTWGKKAGAWGKGVEGLEERGESRKEGRQRDKESEQGKGNGKREGG